MQWMRISELDLGTPGAPLNHLELVRLAAQDMTDRDHSRLENSTIFYFCAAYNREEAGQFEWVRRCERADCRPSDKPPDYLVATEPNSAPQFVEVTEVLDRNRKRQKEYREILQKVEQCGIEFAMRDLPETPADYESELIRQAVEVLQGKFGKRYPVGTWLVVYFNPALRAPRDEDSHLFGIRVIERAVNELPPPDRIEQVWILSNTLKIARLL